MNGQTERFALPRFPIGSTDPGMSGPPDPNLGAGFDPGMAGPTGGTAVVGVSEPLTGMAKARSAFETYQQAWESQPAIVRYGWKAIQYASSGACAYHGYRRNQSLFWAVMWGFLGGVVPVIALPVAFAQGFGDKKNGRNGRNGKRGRR